jgi:hypothetical protein
LVFIAAKRTDPVLAMSSNSSIKMIHCYACMVTAPRNEAELAGPSGRICLVCGSRLISEAVGQDFGWTVPARLIEKPVARALGIGDAPSG